MGSGTTGNNRRQQATTDLQVENKTRVKALGGGVQARQAGGASAALGGAVQVHPGLSHLTPRSLSGTFKGFQRLKLKYDKLLSNFGFKCNLRHYNWGVVRAGDEVGRCRLTPA